MKWKGLLRRGRGPLILKKQEKDSRKATFLFGKIVNKGGLRGARLSKRKMGGKLFRDAYQSSKLLKARWRELFLKICTGKGNRLGDQRWTFIAQEGEGSFSYGNRSEGKRVVS